MVFSRGYHVTRPKLGSIYRSKVQGHNSKTIEVYGNFYTIKTNTKFGPRGSVKYLLGPKTPKILIKSLKITYSHEKTTSKSNLKKNYIKRL